MNSKIENLIQTLTSEEKAQLAGEILNDIDPTRTNLKAFFDTLDGSVHGELCNRAESEEER